MQQQGRVLVPLNLDSPKLNINSNFYGNSKEKMPTKKDTTTTLKPLKTLTDSTSITTLSAPALPNANKAFKLSPSKESFFDTLSPLRSQPANSFSILESRPQIAESMDNDTYMRKIMEVEDLSTINKELIEEMENLQNELNEKDRVIHMKSIKLDELIHENNNLLIQLKQEREINESDFGTWLDLKAELEFEIHALRKSFPSAQEIPLNPKSTELDNFSKFQTMQTEINKLKKRVNVLMKENELESQSKMMIMDELEMMRDRYMEIDTKHKVLKQDYDDLVKELLMIRQYENEYVGCDDNCSVVTPTLENSIDEENYASPSVLNIKKKRLSSYESYSTYEDSNSRITSFRNNSLNKAIREVELKAQRQKYQHEIMMYEFENKSLKLQNEKLLSFIGFSLQVKSKDFKTLANKISSSNFDYSDSHNIKSAKKNLKSVIKSASAMPMRPATVAGSLSMSNMKHASTNETIDDFLNNSMNNSVNNSMEYSTDYEQGEMLPLELGTSDSFEEYGDDELDDDEYEEKDMLNFYSHNEKSNDIKMNSKKSNYSRNSKNFSSTASLDVVYKMDTLFKAPVNPSNLESPQNFPPLTPRTHVKRLTPSTFNLKSGNEKEYKDDSSVIENKDFVDDNEDTRISLELDLHLDLDLDQEMNEERMDFNTSRRLRSSSLRNGSSIFSLSQIREEEDDDIKYAGGDSSFEDDDDEDADETINISNAEINMFKIDIPRKFKCPKHSTFLCCTCSGPLIDPQMLQYQISPIYSLMRRLTSRNNSGSSYEQLKWMSKMITGENGSNNNAGRSKLKTTDNRELLRHQLYTRNIKINEVQEKPADEPLIPTKFDICSEEFKYDNENID